MSAKNSGHVTITSGLVEIPCDEDGSLPLESVRAQLPGTSGLWFMTEIDGKQLKKIIKHDERTNKLLAPDGGWFGRTYNASYPPTLGYFGNKELERFETASRLFHESMESATKVFQLDAQLSVENRKMHSFSMDENDVKIEHSTTLERNMRRARSAQHLTRDAKDVQTENLAGSKESEIAHSKSLLEKELMTRTEKLSDLEIKYRNTETLLNEKRIEVEELKKSMDNKNQEFDYLAGPIEGFNDPQFVQELNSVKKQLDDSKWRCGELEATVSAKNREISALQDWRKEAEHTIHRITDENESGASKRERLEATVHALHQFALVMKKEAEIAKQRAGIDPSLKLLLAENKNIMHEQTDDKIKRSKKDLDIARDKLYRQAEEIQSFKLTCNELENLLSARDIELKLIMKEAHNKEKMLKGEINSLKGQLIQRSAGHPERMSHTSEATIAITDQIDQNRGIEESRDPYVIDNRPHYAIKNESHDYTATNNGDNSDICITHEVLNIEESHDEPVGAFETESRDKGTSEISGRTDLFGANSVTSDEYDVMPGPSTISASHDSDSFSSILARSTISDSDAHSTMSSTSTTADYVTVDENNGTENVIEESDVGFNTSEDKGIQFH